MDIPTLAIQPIAFLTSFRPLEPRVLNLHGHIHNSVASELGARHINPCVESEVIVPEGLAKF